MLTRYTVDDFQSITASDASAFDESQESVLSAVCILLIEDENSLILTKRCDHLPSHPGQICFPGGKHKHSDPDLTATAYRETWEEIGIERSRVKQLGYLQAMHSLSGFFVQPVLGLIDTLSPYTIDSTEVAEMFTLPLVLACDPDSYRHHQIEYQGKLRSYYSIDYQNHHIWGLTGILLHRMATALHRL